MLKILTLVTAALLVLTVPLNRAGQRPGPGGY